MTFRLVLSFLAVTAAATGTFLFDGPTETESGWGTDEAVELKWDNGFRSYSLCWYEGLDNWLAVDFDTSEVSPTPYVHRVRIFTRDDWPNEGYDGFYVALYSWENEAPGEIIWPTDGAAYFFEPVGLPHGDVWVDVPVKWTAPNNRLVAAVNQYYDEPNCDPLALDTNPIPSGHSWMYYNAVWTPFDSTSLNIPNENLMIRLVVDESTSSPAANLKPESFGKIKSLYH